MSDQGGWPVTDGLFGNHRTFILGTLGSIAGLTASSAGFPGVPESSKSWRWPGSVFWACFSPWGTSLSRRRSRAGRRSDLADPPRPLLRTRERTRLSPCSVPVTRRNSGRLHRGAWRDLASVLSRGAYEVPLEAGPLPLQRSSSFPLAEAERERGRPPASTPGAVAHPRGAAAPSACGTGRFCGTAVRRVRQRGRSWT